MSFISQSTIYLKKYLSHLFQENNLNAIEDYRHMSSFPTYPSLICFNFSFGNTT